MLMVIMKTIQRRHFWTILKFELFSEIRATTLNSVASHGRLDYHVTTIDPTKLLLTPRMLM